MDGARQKGGVAEERRQERTHDAGARSAFHARGCVRVQNAKKHGKPVRVRTSQVKGRGRRRGSANVLLFPITRCTSRSMLHKQRDRPLRRGRESYAVRRAAPTAWSRAVHDLP